MRNQINLYEIRIINIIKIPPLRGERRSRPRNISYRRGNTYAAPCGCLAQNRTWGTQEPVAVLGLRCTFCCWITFWVRRFMLLKVGSYVQSDETMIARDKRLTTMLRCVYVLCCWITFSLRRFMLLNYVFMCCWINNCCSFPQCCVVSVFRFLNCVVICTPWQMFAPWCAPWGGAAPLGGGGVSWASEHPPQRNGYL